MLLCYDKLCCPNKSTTLYPAIYLHSLFIYLFVSSQDAFWALSALLTDKAHHMHGELSYTLNFGCTGSNDRVRHWPSEFEIIVCCKSTDSMFKRCDKFCLPHQIYHLLFRRFIYN